MSAVIDPAGIIPSTVTLDVLPTRAMPRRMKIELVRGYVYIYVWSARWQSLAGAHAAIADVTLHVKYPALFAGSSQFWLTAAEASEVERVFGPLGLKIERRA